MFHFSDKGEIENGEVRFQLKATENLKVTKNGSVISFPIKTGDLHYWAMEIHPFILLVFDAVSETAYWLHIQNYVAENPGRVDPEKTTVTVHIPIANQLSIRSIDYFRNLSLETVERLRNQGGFPDVPQKPK